MLMGQPERSAVKEESEIVVSSSLEKMREEKEEEDVPLPAPLANGALKKILKELPEGARVAAETCVQFWKEKKFPTEELIAFLKNISSHSPTLKKSFEDQHNGFLRAMKLQEEQQRKREEEELMERQQVWMRYNSLDGYPSWNHMRHFQPNSTWSGANNFNAGYFHSYPPNMQFIGSRIANSNMPPHPPYHDSLQPMAEYGRQNLFKRTRLDFSERPVTQTMSSSTYSIDDVSKRQRLPSDEPRSAHGVPQISDADLSAAKKALQGRSQRELADHPLGVWLTKKAQQVTSSVFVKVVADVKKTTQQEGISPHTYRCKAILVFRCLPGSVADALSIGMYTHEYGTDAPLQHRGRAVLECIDSTSLFNGETPEERQGTLAAIVQGYIEWVTMKGFSSILMRVPPPTDSNAHLFSPRSLDVRFKASLHLAQWYKRMLEASVNIGVISSYQCSPDIDHISFPSSILSLRDAAAELAFRQLLSKQGSDLSPMHVSAISRSNRFFVAILPKLGDRAIDRTDEPLIDCRVVSSRLHFTTFCSEHNLFFHSVAHAQLSTMTLLHELFKQRVKMSDTGAEDREDGQGSSKGKHDNTGRQGTGGGQSTKATEHEKTEEGEGETRAKGEEEDAAHDQTLLEHEEEEMTEHARTLSFLPSAAHDQTSKPNDDLNHLDHFEVEVHFDPWLNDDWHSTD